MSAEQTPDIERVLAGHEGYVWQRSAGGWTCRCDAPLTASGEPSGEWDAKPAWRAHVARALAPVLAAAVPTSDVDSIADWLGEMPESRNVFDMTDEATTVINIDVETLAERFADRLAAAVREAEQRALREAAAGMSDDIWRGTGPDLHQDYFPAVNSIRVWLHDRAGRVAEPQHEEGGA